MVFAGRMFHRSRSRGVSPKFKFASNFIKSKSLPQTYIMGIMVKTHNKSIFAESYYKSIYCGRSEPTVTGFQAMKGFAWALGKRHGDFSTKLWIVGASGFRGLSPLQQKHTSIWSISADVTRILTVLHGFGTTPICFGLSFYGKSTVCFLCRHD